MAFLTGGGSVHSQKRETGQVMIEYDTFRPAAFLMAPLTLFAFLSLVYVITEVTAVAFHRQVFFVQFAAMACGAGQFGMLPFEREFGVFVVVEVGVFPTLLSVAGITLLAVAPAVLIVILVAAVAILFGFYLGDSFLMACLTDDLFVSAC
jgi:hypothetical protein